MKFTRTRIEPDIDLAAEGKHFGFLRIPHAVHRSAYGWLPMPVISIKNSDGPRILLMGGNHGDEYEGQIALCKLARSLEPEAMQGHLVVLPMANYPAARAGRRTSPIDEGNLNRSFPGDPNVRVSQPSSVTRMMSVHLAAPPSGSVRLWAPVTWNTIPGWSSLCSPSVTLRM